MAITPDISDWRVVHFPAGSSYVDAVKAVANAGQRAADSMAATAEAARRVSDSMRVREVGDQAEIDRAAREALAKRPSVPLDDEGRPTLWPSPKVKGSARPQWQAEWRMKRQMFGGDLDRLNEWEAATPMEQRQ